MARATSLLIVDGSHGEGGGQILRTAVTLSALTGRPLRVERVRAGRPKPGLAAQHLTAIRAAAAVVGARLEGDDLGSTTLEFHPGHPPRAGIYRFDAAEAREGGSAGAASLILQTVALPMAFAGAESRIIARGGTHVPWSPSFDFLDGVWLETLRRLGLEASARLVAWGFYPAGGGEIVLEVRAGGERPALRPLAATQRGPLVAVEGRSVAANLPAHIAERMAAQAETLLKSLSVPVAVTRELVSARSPGAWIFLEAVYGNCVAGFGALGRRGRPAELVAEEAASALLAHHLSGAALDRHLADQMLLPLALAHEPSEFTCAAVTRHLETNAWVIEAFEAARIAIRREPSGTGRVTVTPRAAGKG